MAHNISPLQKDARKLGANGFIDTANENFADTLRLKFDVIIVRGWFASIVIALTFSTVYSRCIKGRTFE